ncbi:MAG: hypothetical protein SWY16_18880 [Cyanobacteriota bacterium]|nr:hypothetical protein [Cyanobacteriota bacterium]
MKRKLTFSVAIGFTSVCLFGVLPDRRFFESEVIAATSAANGQIVQVEGNARLERQAQQIRPLPGTPIYPGDRLLASREGTLVVQCTDLTIASISTEQPNHCATASAQSCNRDLYECPPRGDLASNSGIPYPISPRRTYLLDDRPQLRWNPVVGATEYTVSLLEDGVELWRTRTPDTQLDYPGDRPLRSGPEYMLVIETDTGVSSLEVDPIPGGFGFGLLDDAVRAEVEEAIAQIEAQTLNESARHLATAFVYVERGLISEAIDILETLAANGLENAPLYSRIGQLYWDYLGLPEHALEPYCQTLELANADLGDLRQEAQERLDRATYSCSISDSSSPSHQARNPTVFREGGEL